MTRRSGLILLLLASLAATGGGWWWTHSDAPRVHGPLPEDAYIWQRSWTEPVHEAARRGEESFRRLILLGGEISWKEPKPEFQMFSMGGDQGPRKAGVALRIGAYRGSFHSPDPKTQWMLECVHSLLRQAQDRGIQVLEFHVDFDAGISQLSGFRNWLRQIRLAVAPIPLTLTALPSWLDQDGCAALLKEADGYVLQVHSLERPRKFDDPVTLCDFDRSVRWIDQAGRLGLPFRVSLPTYSYLLAFDAAGSWRGLSAEGPAREWDSSFRLKTLKTDPRVVSRLVRQLKRDHPAALQGLIWFRLPVEGDRMNWSRKTLEAVRHAENLEARVEGETRQAKDGSIEIWLSNRGNLAGDLPESLQARWKNARRVASDGFRDYGVNSFGPGFVSWKRSSSKTWLEPGEERALGWMRLTQPDEVKLEITK